MEKKTKLNILEIVSALLIVFGIFGLGLIELIVGAFLLYVWYWYKKN